MSKEMNKIEEKAKSIPVHWNGHCSALEWPMNPCSFLWIFCQPFSEIYIQYDMSKFDK